MTKKDYIAIARVMKLQLDSQLNAECITQYWVANRDGQVTAIECMIKYIADMCTEDNSNFKRDTFYKACGLDVYGKAIIHDNP
jgi:hypothetical protein